MKSLQPKKFSYQADDTEDLSEAEDDTTPSSLIVPAVQASELVVKKRKSLGPSLSAQSLFHGGTSCTKRAFAQFTPQSAKVDGAEAKDLQRIMARYREWSSSLGVRESKSWAGFVDKLDRLKKTEVRRFMGSLRAAGGEDLPVVGGGEVKKPRVEEEVIEEVVHVTDPDVLERIRVKREEALAKRKVKEEEEEARRVMVASEMAEIAAFLEMENAMSDAVTASQAATQVLGAVGLGGASSQAPTQVLGEMFASPTQIFVQASETQNESTPSLQVITSASVVEAMPIEVDESVLSSQVAAAGMDEVGLTPKEDVYKSVSSSSQVVASAGTPQEVSSSQVVESTDAVEATPQEVPSLQVGESTNFVGATPQELAENTERVESSGANLS